MVIPDWTLENWFGALDHESQLIHAMLTGLPRAMELDVVTASESDANMQLEKWFRG